jgi:membrane protease YdiL (CAAX protease family)
MKSWISRWPVATCYLLTIILSWGYWITLIAQGKVVTPGSSVSHLPGLLGPALAAIIVTAFLEGTSGIKELLGRVIRIRSAWPWGMIVALSPIPLAILVFLMLHLLGKPLPPLHDFLTYPGLPANLSLGFMLFLVLPSNGYGEEIGWRGFMMEKWLPQHGKLGTTLRIAGLWLFWHIPLFWLNQTMASLVGPMLLGWAFGLVCGAFVLAHLYLLSGRSILVLALWHITYNLSVATPATTGIPAAAISTVVMIWGVVIAWKWWRKPDKVRQTSSF